MEEISKKLKGSPISISHTPTKVRVYQAFPDSIANYALSNQHFGGDFSLYRMTWIKTSFLWMMHRSNWGREKGQERTLAIDLERPYFDRLLEEAVAAVHSQSNITEEETWRKRFRASGVIYQLDNERDLHGFKLLRKTLHLGLRKSSIREYAREANIEVRDITDYVKEQYELRQSKKYSNMSLPLESVY